MPTVDHFTRLFDYERRCTDIVLSSLRHARQSVDQLGLASLAAPFERAVAIFCHVQAARQLWLHRLAPDRASFPDSGVFPIWPIERAITEARATDERWAGYIAALTPGELDRAVRYQSTEGVNYESTAMDILTHVVNHSSYHRGQIASLIAATGTKPAITDYIALTRRTV